MSGDIIDMKSKKQRPDWREVYGAREVGKGRWEVVHVESGAHYGTAISGHHAKLFAAALNADINRIYARIDAGGI